MITENKINNYMSVALDNGNAGRLMFKSGLSRFHRPGFDSMDSGSRIQNEEFALWKEDDEMARTPQAILYCHYHDFGAQI
jgi:hypothetical protein